MIKINTDNIKQRTLSLVVEEKPVSSAIVIIKELPITR